MTTIRPSTDGAEGWLFWLGIGNLVFGICHLMVYAFGAHAPDNLSFGIMGCAVALWIKPT